MPSISPTLSLLFSLLLTLLTFGFAPPVCAGTDPIPATVSATARVPSTTSTTSDTTAPSAVILVSPHDGATTNQTKPEFVWKQTFDSNSNNVTYTLKLNGTATYLGISNTGNSQQSNYIAHIGDGHLYLTPTLDLSPGIYDWSVEARDGSGNTSYSTTWRFTIDTTPPILRVTSIDDVYHNPTITEGSNFDLSGPQDVTLQLATEPWATISLTITLPDNTTQSYSSPTSQSGLTAFTLALPLGLTRLVFTSFDSAGLTTTLPEFSLTLSARPYAGILPKLSLPSLFALTTPTTPIPNLPATIALSATRVYTADILLISLALAILILLILIWKRRYNILILDSNTQKPFRSLIVYHSRPTHSARTALTLSRIFITNRTPIMYDCNSSGKLYIRHLGRYSSLTIRTPDGNTHILSLSVSQKRYLLNL